MRFRTKLLLAFIGVTLITNTISVVLMFQLSRHYLFDGYRDKLLSITNSVAILLDPELLKAVQSAGDGNSQAYAQLRRTLRRARNANRRRDTYMKRMFTVVPSKEDPNVLLIAVDSEESLQNAGRLGEVYRGRKLERLNDPVVEDSFVTDEFGTWLRAHAPVRDANGQIAGIVVVEAPSDWVEGKLRPISLSGMLALAFAVLLSLPAVILLSRWVTKPLETVRDSLEAIGRGNLETRVSLKATSREFQAVINTINMMAAGLAERDRVKSAFARYVSQQVLESILQSTSDLRLSGARRRISVLFCDIRGFTGISEILEPEKTVQLLNEYFETMVEVVFQNGGTLDKFIGDGLMVIFGAPQDDHFHEEHALTAAIEMQRGLRKLAEKWKPEGLNLRIGIGINSGPAIVGNIGSSKRMEYTAIGDTVNLASRLESSTKELGVGILISEYTRNAVQGTFRFRSMGAVHVRGRKAAVETFSIEEEEALVTETGSAVPA